MLLKLITNAATMDPLKLNTRYVKHSQVYIFFILFYARPEIQNFTNSILGFLDEEGTEAKYQKLKKRALNRERGLKSHCIMCYVASSENRRWLIHASTSVHLAPLVVFSTKS